MLALAACTHAPQQQPALTFDHVWIMIAPLQYLERQRILAPTAFGAEWAVELTFDRASQGKRRDFRPRLPLVIRY